MYAYRAALADRTSSNVMDVARLAAEDRRAFIRGETAAFATTAPKFFTEKKNGGSGSASAASLVRVVATHHKTGTALMHDVFSAIARHLTNKKYGAFADVRAMEDHPDAFSARKKRAEQTRGAPASCLITTSGKPCPISSSTTKSRRATRSRDPPALSARTRACPSR